MVMYGNGVVTGTDIIVAVATLRELHRALTACSVAVVGATLCATAGVRIVPTIPRTTATTT